jgi:hypothetical protein
VRGRVELALRNPEYEDSDEQEPQQTGDEGQRGPIHVQTQGDSGKRQQPPAMAASLSESHQAEARE